MHLYSTEAQEISVELQQCITVSIMY